MIGIVRLFVLISDRWLCFFLNLFPSSEGFSHEAHSYRLFFHNSFSLCYLAEWLVPSLRAMFDLIRILKSYFPPFVGRSYELF